MTITFRPAVRTNTPLIIGLAGPTKSGKTYSALRLAVGMANGGVIAMINAEGPRGHQYAERFQYVACELSPPYRPDNYSQALLAAKALNPSVVNPPRQNHIWMWVKSGYTWALDPDKGIGTQDYDWAFLRFARRFFGLRNKKSHN